MILYSSDYFGVLQLKTFSGSAVYRTVLPSLLSSAFFYVYKYTLGQGYTAQEIKHDVDEAIYTAHPFVITIYIMAFSLIINHRLNYCYQRYWEACSNIFMMSSKWIDSATTLAAFHYQSSVYEEDRPRCFGDEDKPLNELKDKDKKKSAPTGGNTRTAMNRNITDPMAYYRSMSREDLGRTSASDTSDSASSVLSASGEPYSSFSPSAGFESSMASKRSFLTTSSRERVRKYTDEENYDRAKSRFSSSSFSVEHSLRSIFPWARSGKRKYQSKSSLSDWNESHGRLSHNSILGGSSLFDADPVSSGGQSNAALTPPRSNLSTVAVGDDRTGLAKYPSMPAMQKKSSRMGFSIRKHRKTKSDRPSLKEDGTERKSLENKSRHRRIPSSDIPMAGVDGSVVKSFKPNPSLAWQKRNRVTMPKNTGLHSTVFHAPIDFDFESLLLEEEKERQRKYRQKQVDDYNKRMEEQNATKEGGRESLFATARRRSSLPTFKASFLRSLSNAGSEIAEDSPPRIASDPTRVSGTSESVTQSFNSTESPVDDLKRSSLTNFMPRLELHDLPCLYERPSVQDPKYKDESKPSPKKARVVGPDSLTNGFAKYPAMNAIGNNRARQSSSFRPPVEKMNGRASLFLQEAAHLYSLLSAVSMASLRADMEGVSSPLVDYVPGQKFPPVNPEEMKIKILVDKEYDSDGRISPGNEKSESELRVRITRNNTFTNVIMSLLGMSRNSRQRTIYNASRPFTVLGGISDAEVAMLRKVRGHSAQHALCCLWLREFITREHLNGSTGGVAPPIVARVYQHISDGTAQYNNCRRTAFTDFPFPHAQLTSFFQIVSIFIFPLLYYTYVDVTAIGVALNFFTIACFIGIGEVALELEQPFIRYPNDLPLNNYQAQFNEALISSLYGGFHPDAWGDTVETTEDQYNGTWTDDEGGGNYTSGDEGAISSSAGDPSGNSITSERSGSLNNMDEPIEPKRIPMVETIVPETSDV